MDPWYPAHPKITACPSCVDQRKYLEVVRSFDVAKNPRYAVRDTTGDGVPDTFCNIFVADVAEALGRQLPHWWLGKELSANDMYDWLLRHGPKYGWANVSAEAAMASVYKANLTVAAWKNPARGPGHIAIVLPIPTDDPFNPFIAQAGRENFVGRRLTTGFGGRHPGFFTCR